METKKNWKEEKGLILTIVILGIILIGLLIYVYSPKSAGVKKYSVDAIEITGSCEDCFDTNSLLDSLTKESNVNIKSRKTLDYNSEEAKKIIDKYDIKTIPALIILSKNIKKIGIDEKIFSVNDNYALFDKSVPYIDLSTNDVKGLVQLKEIQADNCKECGLLSGLKIQLESFGIKIIEYEKINSSSDTGKKIIEENNLKFTPALLISKNIEDYWWIFDQIKSSFVEKGDNYMFKNPIPPYIDLTDGKIKGKVDLIFIENKSCENCFNVTELKSAFQSLGIYFYNEKYVDISSSEGKNLLAIYNITAIPTVILSKETEDYDSIIQMLEQIGTFESDGKFVFRKLDSLNVEYQNIK